MRSVKGSRVRSHKACARSACARRATVGWLRQVCRTWRPPRPSTLIASQLGWPSVRSLRPASRALPPSRPEHFANGVRTVPGSAFAVDWGSGYDLVLLTNFLHHFDQETCVGLLERARKSLGEGGRVLGVEFVPNVDRVSPPFAAMFAFAMLGSMPSGDAYTAREFETMGRAAGFARVRVEALPPTPQSLVTFEQS